MKSTIALLACAAALGLQAPVAEAGPRVSGNVVIGVGGYGHGHGGHWRGHGHRHWRGAGLGVVIGAPLFYPAYPSPYHAYPHGYVVAEPVPVVPPMAQPMPVITPRHNQSAAQLEADRRDCDRWAVTQPAAMADAHVFHRATLACLDQRGYSIR
jgi:hypothetical protein